MERYKSTIAFVDLLFNILLGIFILFYLSQLLINEPSSQKIDSTAQVAITLDWPDGTPSDIDLWIMDPLGTVVGYQNEDGALMHLERDDLGNSNDTIYIGDQKIVVRANHEIITLRGLISGEYKINVHYYKDHTDGTPVPLQLKLIQINPKYKLVMVKDVIIKKEGDEISVFQFVINTKDGISGKVISVTEEQKHFVVSTKLNGIGNEAPNGTPNHYATPTDPADILPQRRDRSR